MNENFYVAGGAKTRHNIFKYCERYNLNDGNWNNSIYELPFPLFGAVAAMSKDSSFAVITGGQTFAGGQILDLPYNKKIITFTEQEGFKIFPLACRGLSLSSLRISALPYLMPRSELKYRPYHIRRHFRRKKSALPYSNALSKLRISALPYQTALLDQRI